MTGAHVGVSENVPIGRAKLIEHVVDVLRDGGATCLVGEPGVGKTTVWRACVDRISHARPWTFTCSEHEQELGLTVLAELFAWAPTAVLDQLPPPQRHAADVVLLESDLQQGIVDRRLLGMTTSSVLAAMARTAPVLLAIDDLQWCDHASLSALGFALRRIDPAMVTVFATKRPAGPAIPWSDREIRVDPLPPSDVKRLVHEAGGVDLPGRVVDRIVQLSGGNPLYAVELVRPLPQTVERVRVPLSLRSLLSSRLTGLPAACQEALLDVAVWGSTNDDRALAPAYADGILHAEDGRIRFDHPMLAELVREPATDDQLRAAHNRAAGASTDSVQRARHRAAAVVGCDEDVAKELDEAVSTALHRGDLYGARDLAEAALALSAAGGRPVHRLAALARCEGNLGHAGAARELAIELLSDAKLVSDRFLALMILADNPPASAALSYANEAANLDGISADDRLQAIGLRAKILFVTGRTVEARTALSAALSEATEDSPVKPGLTAYLAIMTRLTGDRHDETALIQAVEAERSGALTPGGSALEIAGMVAMFDDRHDEARHYFTEATGGFAERHAGSAGAALASLACRVGDLQVARELADRGFEEHGDRPPVRYAAMLADVCAWQGDVAGVHRARDAARLADQDIDVIARARLDYATGFAALLSGDVRVAWELLRKVCDLLEADGFREPSRVPALPIAVEAAAAIGDLSAAEMLCARLEAQSEALDSRWGRAGALRSRGHILLAQGHFIAAANLFDDAADAYTKIALPLERARAVLAAGGAMRREGRRRMAKQRLLDCRGAFELAGAQSLLLTAEAELARLGGRTRRAESVLTDAERQVADLAATGLRNSEIAVRLSISAKTVENHLGKIYRKLGVRGRAELAAQQHHDDGTV